MKLTGRPTSTRWRWDPDVRDPEWREREQGFEFRSLALGFRHKYITLLTGYGRVELVTTLSKRLLKRGEGFLPASKSIHLKRLVEGLDNQDYLLKYEGLIASIRTKDSRKVPKLRRAATEWFCYVYELDHLEVP